VSTYGSIAAFLGSSSRAVGNALRKNPFHPIVPCHRVVSSTLELGGFFGATGLAAPEVGAQCRREQAQMSVFLRQAFWQLTDGVRACLLSGRVLLRSL
jgi:alkylated DNA nucleotide flippase Atl1